MFYHLILLVALIAQGSGEQVIMTLKYSNYRVKPTIVNGHPSGKLDHPYLVSIKEPVYSVVLARVWANLCGGSIISNTKVLTAAHCFEGNNFFYQKRPYILRVIAGHTETVVNSSLGDLPPSAQSRSIENVVIHGGFHFPANDIALVTVKQPWNFTASVDFIPFARKDVDYRARCLSMGFGRTGHEATDRASKVLLEAYLYLMTKSKCAFVWQMNMDKYVCTDSVFSDVSRGDSGGPLICKNTGDGAENDRGVLVGVVSGKNFDKTTLFTRVAKFSNWIARGGTSRLKCDMFCLIILFIFFVYYLFVFLYLILQSTAYETPLCPT